MVVCKYFMEGYCKFGVRCKFDHVDPYSRGYDSPRNAEYSSERPQGTSILKAASSSFGSQEYSHSPHQGFVQPQQHGFSQLSQMPQQSYHSTPQQGSFVQKPSGLKYNVQEIMQIVVRDITQLEKGGQWQLSSYSPLKELPNMPGLEDYSPEELRWECYKALQNGSLPLCQVIVQQLYGNVAKIYNDLKRKDSGYSIIERWLRDSEQRAAQTTAEQPASAFASSFGGSNVTASAFGSPFFASKPQSQQQQSVPQPQPQSAASSFSFSLSPQQPISNAHLFQQNNSVFSSNQTSAFASSNQATSPFASSNQTTSPFASSNQATSPFASSNQAISPFASSNQTTPAFTSQSVSTYPIRTQAVDSQVYSTNEALSEAELRAFQADRFVLGSIPTKPPPRALCNL